MLFSVGTLATGTDCCLVYSVRENNTAYLEQGCQTQEGIVFREATKFEHNSTVSAPVIYGDIECRFHVLMRTSRK